MTVKKTNRSHQVIYMVFLLVLTVALATALLLAGERGSVLEKHVVQSLKTRNLVAHLFAGEAGC